MTASKNPRVALREHADYSEFERLLIRRRDELLNRDEYNREQINELQKMGDSPGDDADTSVIDTSSDYFLQLADRERQEVLEIRHALEKIHHGTYGVCEECSQPIPAERLRSMPHARFCRECMAVREARARGQRPHLGPKL